MRIAPVGRAEVAQRMLEIQLGGSDAVALVDDVDRFQAGHRWSLHTGGYAFRREHGRSIYLHREILGLRPGDGLVADHVNRDRLDCRRLNLRVVTPAGNAQNVPGRSPLRGVCAEDGLFYAKVSLNGVQRRVGGRHLDPLPAARAAEAYRRQHMPCAVPDRSLEPVGSCPCKDCATLLATAA